MRVICVWPDGSWCDLEDLDDYRWMSDDFQRIEVSWDIDDEQVDSIATAHVA
jgi:hypothetical protein